MGIVVGRRVIRRKLYWWYSSGVLVVGGLVLLVLAAEAVGQGAWRNPTTFFLLAGALGVSALAESVFDPLGAIRRTSSLGVAVHVAVALLTPPWIAAWGVGLAGGIAAFLLERPRVMPAWVGFARQGLVAGVAAQTYWSLGQGAALSLHTIPAAAAGALAYWYCSTLLTIIEVSCRQPVNYSRRATFDLLWWQSQMMVLGLGLALFYSVARPVVFLLLPFAFLLQPIYALARQSHMYAEVMRAAGRAGSPGEMALAVGGAMLRFAGADYFAFLAEDVDESGRRLRIAQVGRGRLSEDGEKAVVEATVSDDRELLWWDLSLENTPAGVPSYGAVLSIPVRAQGRCIGAAILFFGDPLNVQSAQMLPTLRMTATQLGNIWEAWDQLRRGERELRRRSAEFAALRRVSWTAGAAEGEDDLLIRVAREAIATLGARAALVCVRGERGSDKCIAVTPRRPEPLLTPLPADPASRELCRRGEPSIANLDDYPTIAELLDGEEGALLSVPLVVQGRHLGGLCLVGRPKPAGFDRQDLALAQAFANQAAVGMGNARWFAEEEHRRKELQLLADLSLALLDCVDAGDVCEHTAALLQRLLPNQRVTVTARHGVTGDTTASIGPADEPSPTRTAGRIAADRWIVAEGRGVRVADVVEEGRFAPIHHGTRSLIGVPIRRGADTIGAIVLESREPGRFGEAEQQLLAVVAGQMAVALEKADLLRRANEAEAAHQMDRLKSEFIANLSHELRTPLTSLAGYAEMLGGWDFPGERVKEMGRSIHDEAVHLSTMIDGLLDMSRIEAGRFSIQRQRMLVESVVEAVACRFAATGGGERISWRVDSPLPPVYGDEVQVGRVLINLIDNALRYSPEGSTVEVTASAGPDEVTLGVRDRGFGIASRHLDRIFDRFYRVEDKRIAGVRGTGLGLAICKHIVEVHEGRIWVESEVGRGSTFYFTLPVWRPVDDARARIEMTEEGPHEL